MRMSASKVLCTDLPTLPKGFSFRMFDESCIGDWARIETSVLEFASEAEAEDYFVKSYLPYADELKKRCVFVVDNFDKPIATATAWFADSTLGYQAALNWVSVDPRYQGLGLGKAIVKKALQIFAKLEHGKDVWLHTQTWSWVAVMLYHSLGFNILRADRLANLKTRNGIAKIYQNDCEQAIEVLKSVLNKEQIKILVETSK